MGSLTQQQKQQFSQDVHHLFHGTTTPNQQSTVVGGIVRWIQHRVQRNIRKLLCHTHRIQTQVS